MADDDEVAKADESPARLEEGLGPAAEEVLSLERIEETYEELEAVVESGEFEVGGSAEVEGAGIGGAGVELDESGAAGEVEFGGDETERDVVEDGGEETQIGARNEIEIVRDDDDPREKISECKKDDDVTSTDVAGGSELPSELDVKLEAVVATEDYLMNDAIEEKGEEFEKNPAAEECAMVADCGDKEQVGESSKVVKEEDGEEKVAGKSDSIGMITEDWHMKDAEEEKGEEFEKNVDVEQCEVMSASGDMEQIDQSSETVKKEDEEENVAGDCDLIGTAIEDCHMNAAAEEKGEEFERNLAAEPDQIDESRSTLKEEEVGDENVAGNSDLSGKVIEDCHMNDAVEEKGDGFEKHMAAEKCNVVTAIGEMDQADESRIKLKKEEVGDENVAGNSDSSGKVIEDCHMNDVVEDKGGKFEKDLAVEQCAVVTAIGDMGQIDESMNKLNEDEVGEENVEFTGVALTGDQINESDNLESEGGDGDEEMGSEEENVENKEKVEQDLSAVPNVEFSSHNVELEPTTGEDDEEHLDGEEPLIADAEIKIQIDTPDAEKNNTKPKRGRKPSKVALTKKTEEDVCFICFDGGDLVVCDRR